jgi:glyoxylate reductase/D-3-phosphoglycerate dehydrogenase
MPEQKTIVFLYSQRLVPPEIMQMARELLPAEFSLEWLEQGEASAIRRDKFARADIMFAYPGNPSAEDLTTARKLKLFQVLSAGYEWLDLAAFKRAGVPVANNGGANAPTVAEHAILLILAVYKKLPLHHNTLHEGRWLGAQETLRMREFRGKTLGIIGFGRIGRELAQIARGFQTTICYYDAVRAPAAVEQSLGATFVSFDELLTKADVVSIHTPLTSETKGFINARALGLMKPSAILINTSRGPVIDEPALIAALREKRIAGAGLDVFVAEPLPAESPFLSLDNVVLTSHIAGVTLDTWSRRLAFAFDNARRVASGQAPESIIVG